jgi:hypothetical protein
MGGKSEVYSWRLSPILKASLEEAARRRHRTVAQLLEDIVTDHLSSDGDAASEEGQRQLHRRMQRFAGRISGKDPGRAARARLLVRARLRRTRGVR